MIFTPPALSNHSAANKIQNFATTPAGPFVTGSQLLLAGRSLLQLQTIKNNKGIAVKSTYALVTNYFTALKSIYKYIKPLMHY